MCAWKQCKNMNAMYDAQAQFPLSHHVKSKLLWSAFEKFRWSWWTIMYRVLRMKWQQTQLTLIKIKSANTLKKNKIKQIQIWFSWWRSYWRRVYGSCWIACTRQHLAVHLMTQQMVPCRDRLYIRTSVSSQSAETGAKTHITAVASTGAHKVQQFFFVFFPFICQHLHRQGVANTLWYDEAGQSPRTVRTDPAVRKSASDSLIRNMHTNRQPEMIL